MLKIIIQYVQKMVNENMKKMEQKREKEGLPPQKITNQAHQNVRNINKIEKGKKIQIPVRASSKAIDINKLNVDCYIDTFVSRIDLPFLYRRLLHS